MIEHLVTFWMWVWSKPTRLWCYVTGRTPQSFARLTVTVAHIGIVVRTALTTYGGAWAAIDVLFIGFLTYFMLGWRQRLRKWEQMTRYRDDGTIYQYANVPHYLLRSSAVICSLNVALIPLGQWTVVMWTLWFSTPFIAAQHEGGGKTLKQTARNLVARIKAIRLPSLPRWRPAPAPRPIPV